MVGAVRLATVGVSDMHIALGLFRELMRFKVERRGPVPRPLLKAWGLPAKTVAHMVELSCKGYPFGRLRLVEFDPSPTQRVRADFGPGSPDSPVDVGPQALGLHVADPILPSVRKIEGSGHHFRSRPVTHRIGDTPHEECTFLGPDGVPIQLTVSHRKGSGSQRPRTPDGPFSEVQAVMVVAGDLKKTRAFYEGVLGLIAVDDAEAREVDRDAVSELTGAPRGTRIHFLVYGQRGESSGQIQCLHFFERTGKRLARRMKPGHLGLSLLTHDTDDINALHTKLRAAGAEIVTAPTLIEGDGAPYRVMLAKGPNEEMFEFVQAGLGPVASAAKDKKTTVASKASAPAKSKIPAKPSLPKEASPAKKPVKVPAKAKNANRG